MQAALVTGKDIAHQERATCADLSARADCRAPTSPSRLKSGIAAATTAGGSEGEYFGIAKIGLAILRVRCWEPWFAGEHEFARRTLMRRASQQSFG